MNTLLLMLFACIIGNISAQDTTKWQVQWDAENNQFIGKKNKWPDEQGEWKFFKIYVNCQSYRGSALNDYCDGNWRPLGEAAAKKYCQKFEKLYWDQKKDSNT